MRDRADRFRNSRPCGAALVTDGSNRLLLVRRNTEPWRGAWDIPGGHCETTEHPADTAVRETLEESGYSVRVVGFRGIWMCLDPARDGAAAPTMNIYFDATLLNRPMATVDGSETVEVGWFSADALPPEIAFPDPQADVLRYWRGGLRRLSPRDHGSPA